MSLLMQALRKAERAKQGVQLTEPHREHAGLQLEPLETDIQRAAAGSEEHPVGGPAFSLEPLEPAVAAADLSDEDDTADIPVIPATEVVHDPVPPQARPGSRRSPAAAARAAAEARLASDMPHGPRSPGGLSADEAPHAASPADASDTFSRSHGRFEGLRASDPAPGSAPGAVPGASPARLRGAMHDASPAGAHDAIADASSAWSRGAMPGASPSGSGDAMTGASSASRRGATPGAPPAESLDAITGTPSASRRGATPGASPAGSRDAMTGASSPGRRGATTGALPAGSRDTMTGPSSASYRGATTGAAPAGSHGAIPGAGPGGMPGVPHSMRRGAGGSRAASAASNRRLAVLVGLLVFILLAFGFIYFRAIGGRPGAALPPVPMPAPGSIATAPSAVPGTVIPGVDTTRPGAQPAATPGTPPAGAIPPGSQPVTAATPGGSAIPASPPGASPTRAPEAQPGAQASASGRPSAANAVDTATVARSARTARPGRGPAAATRPNREVIIPTPEALAAIQDPAIRAEAMRDAEERAARAARDAGGPHPAGAVGDAGAATAGEPPAGVHPAAPATAHTVAPFPADTGDVRIVRNNAAVHVSPAVQNGWSAYNAGDLTAARQQYDAALLQDPNNRDALLGSAAVAIRERNGRQAAANYVRLLELDPNDPEALAGLVALRPGDIEQAESRLKAILQHAPDSGPVQFALGNLYARQGRWPEAQQSYFRAFTAAPTNPDYAFNLAVGLDRLNQGRLAQSYYQRALALAQAAPAGFDPNAVRKRLQELGATAP
jgi:tetratricopeptide (TPR) repeat protein